ncbi:MAG: acetyltransferase [Synechococcales bacterium]|nr:acetyltransferase [Synechococcales bacterium]
MFLKDKQTDELVKITDVEHLFSPSEESITGCIQGGQNEQPPQSFNKRDLMFPSGEALPQCWVDANYRMKMPPQPQPKA